jgi:hypothetical protein
MVVHKRETHTIYILKNPLDDMPFYVGRTTMGLNYRLIGHLSQKTGNLAKIEYIASMLKSGKRPIIEAIETINGICHLDKVYAAHREIFWIQHYKSMGFKLFNVFGMQEEAKAEQYVIYQNDVQNGRFVSWYYYCGKTSDGFEVYDEKRMNLDGFYIIWKNDEPRKVIDPSIPLSEYIPYIKEELDALGTIPDWINATNLTSLLPPLDWSPEFASTIPPDEFLLDLQTDDDLDADYCDDEAEPDDEYEELESDDYVEEDYDKNVIYADWGIH